MRVKNISDVTIRHSPKWVAQVGPAVLISVVLLFSGACKAFQGSSSDTNSELQGRSESSCRMHTPLAGPTLYDCTGVADPARVNELAERAIKGLGFPAREGPRGGDYIFVGRYYLAWIDNTGFSGKLNGLWSLNGQIESLDFSLSEPTHMGQRPISMLLPGEDGDGQWPRAYNGAEHYEIPRFKNGRHDSQAGIIEANHFTDAPKWWRQCINANNDPTRWDTSVGASKVVLGNGEITFHNEAPLTIVARFHEDSFACGTSYPVNDHDTTELRLATAYTMYANKPVIGRHYQMVNAGDHAVANDGMEKLIGGQLLTDWPHPHYLKQYQNYIAWNGEHLSLYSPLNYLGEGQSGDLINVHGAGRLILSATPELQDGRSIGMIQNIDHAGEDFGICLCIVHGGFEFTGSVLAGQHIPPKSGDSPSRGMEQMRTITLERQRNSATTKPISSVVLQAEDGGSDWHQVGSRDGNGLSVRSNHGKNEPGFLLHKRSVAQVKGNVGQAIFYLEIDHVDGVHEPVLEIDLLSNEKNILAKKTINRQDFFANHQLQRFVLDFQVPDNGVIKPRVRWLGGAWVKLDAVVVNSVN